MRVAFTTFISLDGVTQGPGSPDEDTSDGFTRGGWFVPYLDETFIGMVHAWAERSDAHLFGRRTYTAFAEAWPTRDPDDPVARSLNGSTKYVASSSLTDAEATWGPVTILRGDVAAEVRSLKEEGDGEIQIHGSTTLGRSMIEAGVVDELRLVVAPVVVGGGRRLFERSDHMTGLRLVDLVATPGGLAVHTYAVEGSATVGAYDPEVHAFAGDD